MLYHYYHVKLGLKFTCTFLNILKIDLSLLLIYENLLWKGFRMLTPNRD